MTDPIDPRTPKPPYLSLFAVGVLFVSVVVFAIVRPDKHPKAPVEDPAAQMAAQIQAAQPTVITAPEPEVEEAPPAPTAMDLIAQTPKCDIYASYLNGEYVYVVEAKQGVPCQISN
jgi:hypothetical protein